MGDRPPPQVRAGSAGAGASRFLLAGQGGPGLPRNQNDGEWNVRIGSHVHQGRAGKFQITFLSLF